MHHICTLVNSLDETKLLLSRRWLGRLSACQTKGYTQIHFSSLETLRNHVPGSLEI